MELNPSIWLTIVSQHKVRDTFCSYGKLIRRKSVDTSYIFNFLGFLYSGVMELCTKGMASSVGMLKQRGINLACVRTCVVVAEERPRVHLSTNFSKLFSGLGLSPRAVSTSFGCRINVAICLQVKSLKKKKTR